MTGECRPLHPLYLAAPAPTIPLDTAPLWRRVLDNIILPRRYNASSWQAYYDDLVEVLLWKVEGRRAFSNASALQSLRTVEVGTMYGGATERILQRLAGRAREHFVVDPFLAGFDDLHDSKSREYGAEAKRAGITNQQLSRAWAKGMAFDFQEKFGCRCQLLYAKSLEAAPHFADGSLDAAFIDGLHTYRGVLADIQAWWPKLSSHGGVMLFNDYASSHYPGVERAVKEFMQARGLKRHIAVGHRGRPPGWRNAYVVKWRD